MRNLAVILFSIILLPVLCTAQVPLDEDHVAISDKVIRVGPDIAYYDENGILKVAEAVFAKEGDIYKCETTKLKVYVDSEPQNSPWPLQVKYGGEVLNIRIDSLGYYNPQTHTFREIFQPQYSVPDDTMAPYYVHFNNVFPGINLGYLLTCETIFSMIKIMNAENLPPPQAGEEYLGTAMEIDLLSLPGYRLFVRRGGGVTDYYAGSNLEGLQVEPEQICSPLATGDNTRSRRIPILLPGTDGSYEIFFRFDDERIFTPKFLEDIDAYSHPLRVITRTDNKDYLLNLMPFSELDNGCFPVILSFSSSGGKPKKNSEEIFLPSYTYIIENNYSVKSLTSLGTPDQPVYVKYLPYPDYRIAITKKGRPEVVKVDNTIFTSIYDSNPLHGAVIDLSLFYLEPREPLPGDYGRALDAVKGPGSFIRNSQFYYAMNALTNFSPSAPDNTQEITNVLIDNCSGTGVRLMRWGDFSNNTIRRCGKGVEVALPSSGEVTNCIFAENQNAGVNELPASASGNVWFSNNPHVENGSSGTDAITEADGLVSPFTDGPGGDSHLRTDLTDNNGNVLDLSNTGFKYPGNN